MILSDLYFELMKTHCSTLIIAFLFALLPQILFSQETPDKWMVAIGNNNLEEAKKMLDEGTDPDEYTMIGATPLMHAICFVFNDIPITRCASVPHCKWAPAK